MSPKVYNATYKHGTLIHMILRLFYYAPLHCKSEKFAWREGKSLHSDGLNGIHYYKTN
jgi:hypothetical protein